MFDRANKKRKLYLPFMILAIIYTLFYFGFTLYYIIFVKEVDIFENIIIPVASVIGIIGTVFTTIYIGDCYDLSIIPIIRKDFLDDVLAKRGLKFVKEKVSKEEKQELKSSGLIGKKHGLSIIYKIVGEDFTLYEISMLSDLRFRGYMVKAKAKEEAQSLDYCFCNIKYYYKHKPKNNFLKTVTGFTGFDQRFKTYTKRRHIFNETRLDVLKRNTMKYRVFGYSKVGDKKFILLSYTIKDGQRLFLPSVFEPFNDDYLGRINTELDKFIELSNLKIE